MGKNVFVTGGSGFLGREVLRRASLKTEDVFYVLSRSEASDVKISDSLMHIDQDRIQILRGDLNKPYLGIDSKYRKSLRGIINEIWHMAASTSFENSKRDEIFATNLYGTRNVIDVAKEWSGLDRIIYMGTAYVCGTDQREIPETGLEKNGRKFKNPYEESKLISEEEVRKSELPFVVLRPSIIVGDSRTGEAQGERRMVYGYLRGLYQAAMMSFDSPRDINFWNYWKKVGNGHDIREFPIRLRSNPDTTKNFVPIDDVVNVTMDVIESKDSLGKTYNIVNENNLTMREIVDAMQRSLKITGANQIPNWEKTADATIAERAAFKTTPPYWPYTHVSEPKWRDENTRSLPTERIVMTKDLFQFLMDSYVDKELRPNGNSHY
jgi:nucleoside-diphosphate-sugar epimerase